MFDRIKRNFYWIILLVSVLLMILMGIISGPLNQNSIDSEKNSVFSEKWEYSIDDGPFREITLPYSEKEAVISQITLKNRLPRKLSLGETILLRTSQQDVAVSVDGAAIYSSYADTDGADAKRKHVPSSAYHFVRLPLDGAGKTILVTLTSPFRRYAGLVNEIYIGSKASQIFFLFRENGFHFLIGALIFCIGFFTMAVFLFAKEQKRKEAVIYLGAFFACAGIWLIVESRMMQFVLPYPMLLTNVSFIALTLLPVFFGLYYYSTHENIFRRYVKLLVAIMTVSSIGFSVLTSVNPLLPLRALPIYLVLTGIYLVVVFLSLLAESIRAGKLFSLSVCGGIVLGIFSILEMSYYLYDLENYNNSNFLIVGLLLFCAIMMTDAVKNFMEVYREVVKVRALTVLAYTDSLTGLKNRAAFLESLAEIEMREEELSLAMFDINNLKPVNDTQGHLVGDAMLRHSAKTIKASLRREDELYRIGGDEFAAILCHDRSLDLRVFEERLEAGMERENKMPLSYRLSVAYGFATFTRDSDKTLFDTLARADERMYARKRVQKAAGAVRNS